MYSIVYYSHSDYSDVWPAMFAQTDKHMPGIKKYLFSDQSTSDLNNDWILVKYDDDLGYQKRVSSCLEQVKEKTIIFHHEDMFLYDAPDLQKLDEFVHLVADEREIDIIKLARASYDEEHSLVKNTNHDDVYENPRNLLFAIQPSVCNKEKLKFIYDKTYGNDIWEFETNSGLICAHFGIKTGMIWQEGDDKRGMYHWDSGIYPYIATAVVKGKWNIADYGEILENILQKNDIDVSKRGSV